MLSDMAKHYLCVVLPDTVHIEFGQISVLRYFLACLYFCCVLPLSDFSVRVVLLRFESLLY